MSELMMENKPLVIDSIRVGVDADGRYCLNDLHRASGGKSKDRPNYWMENQQTKALIREIEKAGIPAISAKQGLGTFVCKELVYAYAMWIDAAFNLKVIRAFDSMQQQAPQVPQTKAEALRLAADQAERIEQQERELEQARPAIEFTKRVIESDDTIRIGEAAKIIGTGQNRLFSFLRQHGFLTRKNEPYQSKIDAGLMDVKLSKQFEHPRAGLTRSITPLITGKGLAKIQRLWAEAHAGEVA
ncbi:MAG: phage antirepressor KilAC domain-containing protein [Phycisphaerae bacterium]